GVVVYTRVHTPRRCGESFRAAVDVADFLLWRPLRTSWLMVGMNRLSLAGGLPVWSTTGLWGRCSYQDSRASPPGHGRPRQPLSLAYWARSSSSRTASTMVKPNRLRDHRSKRPCRPASVRADVRLRERRVERLRPVADHLVAALRIVREHVREAEPAGQVERGLQCPAHPDVAGVAPQRRGGQGEHLAGHVQLEGQHPVPQRRVARGGGPYVQRRLEQDGRVVLDDEP